MARNAGQEVRGSRRSGSKGASWQGGGFDASQLACARLIDRRAHDILAARAPVRTSSEVIYAQGEPAPGARLPLPSEHEDRGLYMVAVAGREFGANRKVVFRPGDPITVVAGPEGARIMALGAETLGGPRKAGGPASPARASGSRRQGGVEGG